jgi:hypothetical protein|tara:strand:+ start:1348 stop:2259 length:912 start_codon:yes stop_codon:yes gene_type:complete
MSDVLRVHTDSGGIVWCGQNGVGAHCTGFSPEEFVAKSVFKTAPVVRAMGTAENSKLLLAMYERHKKAPVLAKRNIWLASPLICPTKQLRDDPSEVLYRMWQSDTTARVSANWHLMNAVDFNTHLLRVSVDRDQLEHGITDKARVIFQYHPTFSALAFFDQIDLNCSIRMLALILDPRWYVHAERPNRLSKVMNFLGLRPASFRSGTAEQSDSADVVCGSWCTHVPSEASYGIPCNFLHRISRYHGGGVRGQLKASEAFVRFVVLHWLQDLSYTKSKLFDPTLFFKTEAEVIAYNNHMSRVRS